MKAEQTIDLRGELPRGLTLIRADNSAQRHGKYGMSCSQRRPIDDFVRSASELLILSSANDTVNGLRSFFNRRIPIWEGYTRDALSKVTIGCRERSGSPASVANVFIEFVQSVACRFSDSAYGNMLRQEIFEGCSTPKRGKRSKIQDIAKLIIECPDHRGIALALTKLEELMQTDDAFRDIKLDLRREFKEAIRLANYDDMFEGLSHLHVRRTLFRASLPPKAISTIHKAKGLERKRVLIVPCDRKHFGDSDAKRRLLYVALAERQNRWLWCYHTTHRVHCFKFKPSYIMRTSVSGFPLANRREARKLGLLRSKSSEAERERMEPQELNERVCGESPTQMFILMENLG